MATEKKITSRIQQKHDVAANWAKATNFIPKKGEIIIYDAEYNASGEETQAVRFKIGDGSKTVNNLPFAVIDYSSDIGTLKQKVANNSTAIGALQENTVPKTRKINNKALSSDITLGAADVGVNETTFPGLKKTGTVTGVKMNGTTKNPSSGVVDLGTVITAHQDISGKLDKTTYEINKTINFGSSGVLYVGKFKVYDTNVTCEVTSTTNVTYSGKLVIATQNYVIQQMTVYGDAANTVAPNFFIKPSTTSDPYIEVYFKPAGWSKNVVHIYGSNIEAEPTNVCTNVSAVPSTATSKPTNALNSKANLNGGNTFSGAQRFKDSIEFVDSNGDGVLSLGNNAIFVDPEDRGLIPVSFSGSFGLSGQVLTSQGHNTTPMWEYVSKHSYIELTNEDLNTILTPGWYRAPRNHSCKNIPISSPNEFILIVESSSSNYIQQTFYVLGILSECHIRYTNNGGTSWGGAGWYTYRLINTASSKTGQVLTSTGIGAPEWKSMPTYSLSGTELTITLP